MDQIRPSLLGDARFNPSPGRFQERHRLRFHAQSRANEAHSPPWRFSLIAGRNRCASWCLPLLLCWPHVGRDCPPPNCAQAQYDGRQQAVQVMVSSLQPPSAVALVSADGQRYPASGIALVSGPHVLYNPPPSISLGIGGFGFSGCCSGFGSGIGVGVPVGQPTPAEVSEQFLASALTDYATNWGQYHVEVSAGGHALNLAAPHPAG